MASLYLAEEIRGREEGDLQRIKLVFEYEGTRYHGLQVQENAHTVQREMESAIHNLTGEWVKMLFAGRTDTGVHAVGQVGVFDSGSTIPADRWAYALNSYLPEDVRVRSSEAVGADFHPRYQALSKTYRYLVYRSGAGQVFYRDRALCCRDTLDIEQMRKAAALFQGVHDFRAFCASGTSVKTFAREVYRCELHEESPLLWLDIEANGFLYNMVRIIMGTLLEVGRGKLPAERISQILDSLDRSQAGPTAPPQGLYLLKVSYPGGDRGR